ncbi:MAG: ABC transporter permease [Acetobacteraceae bacterium]
MNGVMIRLAFIARRLAKALVMIVAIIILNFFLVRMTPGDPAMVLAGEAGVADPKFMADLRHEFGLDKPEWKQLVLYLEHVARGDLGYSYLQRRPVTELIMQRLPQTLLLTGTAMALALTVGIGLGAVAGMKAGRLADTAITILALLVFATPSFWLGLMAILLFAVVLNWLPLFGMETINSGLQGLPLALDIGRHLILPAATLGLFFVAIYARLTRAAMLEVAELDFVRTARAKGLSEKRVVVRHILRNALLPVVSFAGLQAGYLVGGSVLIETVFAWPGIGRLAYDATVGRDYTVLLGVLIVTSIMVIAFNILTDIVYVLVDPRIAATG